MTVTPELRALAQKAVREHTARLTPERIHSAATGCLVLGGLDSLTLDTENRLTEEETNTVRALITSATVVVTIPTSLEPLPEWDGMSDVDKGCTVLYLEKVSTEGREYAREHYPCRYRDNPALTMLDPAQACDHAEGLIYDGEDEDDFLDDLGDDECGRLRELALDAE